MIFMCLFLINLNFSEDEEFQYLQWIFYDVFFHLIGVKLYDFKFNFILTFSFLPFNLIVFYLCNGVLSNFYLIKVEQYFNFNFIQNF